MDVRDTPGGQEPRMVAVHPDRRGLEFWPALQTKRHLNRSEVQTQRLIGLRVFAADGTLRLVRALEPLSWPQGLRAWLPLDVYDPAVTMRPVYTAPVRYELGQLIGEVLAAKVAGGWRSYVQDAALEARLHAARSFAEVLVALRWAQVEPPLEKQGEAEHVEAGGP